MKPQKKIAGVLAGTLAISGIAVMAFTGTAQAATKNTSTAPVINASPVNQAGLASFGGTGTVITLTAAQVGNDVQVTVSGPNGPYTSAFASYLGNDHQLQSFVRMDGAVNTRGTMAAAPTSPDPVAISSPTYASGFSIVHTFANVSAGSHTFTLTDLLLNGNGAASGGDFGTPAGFDAFYNPGLTTAAVIAGVDWNLSETLLVVGASASVTAVNGQITGVTGYVRPGATASATLTGALWSNSIATGGFTTAFCDSTGTTCDPTAANTLSTNGTGVLAGNVSATATSAATTGNRTIKVTETVSGKTVLVPIVVLGTPTITITPSSGGPNTTVNWTATQFNPLGFGVAHASIANPNGFCAVAGTCTGAPGTWTPVGNYPVGPYVAGPSNVIVGWTASASGNGTGSVVVTDPATIQIQVSQKSIVAGAPANTNLDMTSLGQGTSKALPFIVNQDRCVAADPGTDGVYGTIDDFTAGCDTKQNVEVTVTAGKLTQRAYVNTTPTVGSTDGTPNSRTANVNSSSTKINLGELTSPLAPATVIGNMNDITVSDNRGGLLGWTLSATMTGFTGVSSNTLANSTLSATPSCGAATNATAWDYSAAGQTAIAGFDDTLNAPGVTAGGALQSFSGNVNLCTKDGSANATTQTTGGVYNVQSTLTLVVPAFQAADKYTAVMTVNLV